MVTNGGGFSSSRLLTVRLLRHLGSSSRRLLQNPNDRCSWENIWNWTLLTCTLCWLCAFNLENKPLYAATFLSFIYAFGHFLAEYLIYNTMVASNLTTVGIFADRLARGSISTERNGSLIQIMD